MDNMRRREFITLLGGAAAAWPMAAGAQQPGKLPTIGFLSGGAATQNSHWVAAFVQRLRELGWIEGRTIAIDVRWGEARVERFAEFAAEFVRRRVDVIVTQATQPVVAAMRATSVIPIIFVGTGDPVGAGLVASLARPGGNVTGLSLLNPDLAGKRVELLREVIPALRRLAIMFDIGNPASVRDIGEVQIAARTLGLEVIPLEMQRAEDIMPAFEALKGRAEAMFVAGGPLIVTNRARIHTLAMGARLPAIYYSREYVEAGGLMSYGQNLTSQYGRAAEFVDKILRGAKPADIPVEQPVRFDLVVNLTTAKALGLTIPETFLVRADEVIE
jgi:putative tryptophan/tyrosine transport system substrate-binding protein